ncbi:MAG: hypothetical protein U0575_05955 [Phycisphaerales bacterium]
MSTEAAEVRRVAAGACALADSLKDDDLARARSKIATSLTLAGERPAGRMRRLGTVWTALGRYESLEDDLRRVDALTVDDLRCLARLSASAADDRVAAGRFDRGVLPCDRGRRGCRGERRRRAPRRCGRRRAGRPQSLQRPPAWWMARAEQPADVRRQQASRVHGLAGRRIDAILLGEQTETDRLARTGHARPRSAAATTPPSRAERDWAAPSCVSRA